MSSSRRSARGKKRLVMGNSTHYQRRLHNSILGGLDFSDLERLTLHILRENTKGGDLSPSAIARMYHKQLEHVLVDEYQDINEVQDAILGLVSRECVVGEKNVVTNLFCVGDVK